MSIISYSGLECKILSLLLNGCECNADTWPQALGIQAQPSNMATAMRQRAELVDDIWHACGDTSTDYNWYTKRGLLAGVYAATELFMLTDYSAGYADTWRSLDRRLNDVKRLGGAASEVSAALCCSSMYRRGRMDCLEVCMCFASLCSGFRDLPRGEACRQVLNCQCLIWRSAFIAGAAVCQWSACKRGILCRVGPGSHCAESKPASATSMTAPDALHISALKDMLNSNSCLHYFTLQSAFPHKLECIAFDKILASARPQWHWHKSA